MLTSLSPTVRSLFCLTTLLGTFAGRPATAQEAADPYRPPAISVTHVPQVPAELWEKLRKYQSTRSAAFRGWAPDGRGILVQTRFGQTAQLHRVYEPGGRREQVTFFDEPTNGRFVPADREGYILLTMSSGGSENDQIYVLNDEGEATLLTDGKSRNLLQAVRHDGLFFVVANNQRNGRDTDLYLADPNQPGPLQPILETDGEFWSAADWSRDGATLLLRHYVSINESYAALLEISTGKKTPIQPPAEGKVSFGAMKFAADGDSIYVACDAVSEFKQLARVDLASGGFQWISSEIPWDVEEIEVEPQSGLVAFTINEDGTGGLYLYDPSAAEGNALRRVKTPPA